MAAKTVLAFRIDPGLKATLERLAKKDRRTVSQYLEHLIEDHARAASKRSTGPDRTTPSMKKSPQNVDET